MLYEVITMTAVVVPPTDKPITILAQSIKNEIISSTLSKVQLAIKSSSEFTSIKTEVVLSKLTDAQKEALKNMTDDEIEAEIEKATSAIGTLNTTNVSDDAKAKLEEIKKSLPAGEKILAINFTQHATFAFPVQVTIQLDKDLYPEGTYHLYFYNPETKALEDCGSVEVDSTGLAVFSVSSYNFV